MPGERQGDDGSESAFAAADKFNQTRGASPERKAHEIKRALQAAETAGFPLTV
jgi:hypothetical protein